MPKSLLHHFTMTVASGEGQTSTIEYDGVPVKVHSKAKAIVVAPPLKGSGWVVGNGCCSPINAHRGATLSVDGTAHAAERFAIDFVQLGDNGSLVQGDPTQNESFGYFGDEIYSAAPGKVVALAGRPARGHAGRRCLRARRSRPRAATTWSSTSARAATRSTRTCSPAA